MKNRLIVWILLLSFAAVAFCPLRLTSYADPETAQAEETSAAETEETAQEEPGKLQIAAETEVFWPDFTTELTAASAVVIDVDTGAVLYGKDMHSKRYPASITKLITALVVLDNCDLSEKVVFSEKAVSNLEQGAVTIGTAAGDELTVEECLYALLLKSANEVANALAEHVAGSVEEFCVLMNEKARSLGCLSSDFHNPNGLTNEKHVTTAYDMALIASACMEDPRFMEIGGTLTYHISKTSKNPDGLTVSMGHKMLNPAEQYYDERVKAGKTGFTSASGNTLVTLAESDGRRLAAVVLKDNNPGHYEDTKALLKYGFENFADLSLAPEEVTERFDIESMLKETGLMGDGEVELSLSGPLSVTVPAGSDAGAAGLRFETELPEDAPELACARIRLTCGENAGPAAYVLCREIVPETEAETESSAESSGPSETETENAEGTQSELTLNTKVIFLAAAVIGVIALLLIVILIIHQRRARERERIERIRKRRRERLESLNMTEEEFRERVSRERERRTAGPDEPEPEEDGNASEDGDDFGTAPVLSEGEDVESDQE